MGKIDNGPMGLQFPGESGDVEWVEYKYKFLSKKKSEVDQFEQHLLGRPGSTHQ